MVKYNLKLMEIKNYVFQSGRSHGQYSRTLSPILKMIVRLLQARALSRSGSRSTAYQKLSDLLIYMENGKLFLIHF